MHEQIINELSTLKLSSRQMHSFSNDDISRFLLQLSELMLTKTKEILEENRKDLERMDANDPKYDRLLLNQPRIEGIAQDMRNVALLPSPLNRILDTKSLKNGLSLQKVSVPIGVLGIVFESRPNVTFDVFALCFKSGNACVLKGSRDAQYSNRIIVNLIEGLFNKWQMPSMVYLAPSERSALLPVITADSMIDAIIPRGGQGLIQYVRKHSKVPVIETGAGIVHTYIDQSANIIKAKDIVKNAKTRRVSVCNALDTLLVHIDRLPDLPFLLKNLDQDFGLKIYADPKAYQILINEYDAKLLFEASSASFGTEFLSMKLAIKIVENIDAAIDHIYNYSSKHSEAIIAEDDEAVNQFMTQVDAAVIYANASTAFTDGAQFGLGAEIGISTQKLHARGPMALNELTSYKWKVYGSGQVRT